jgi:hypothetical protein
VTGSEGAGGPPLRIRFDVGEDLVAPDGWPHDMPPPELNEPLPTYWNRVVIGDTFFQSLMAPAVKIGIKSPVLEVMRPADLTLEWWQNPRPETIVPSWVHRQEQRDALNYHLLRIARRLAVELVGRFLAGDPVVEGTQFNIVGGQSVVPPDLWRNPDMVFSPSAGLLRPGGGYRPGRDLPSFINLTLRPAALETKREKSTRRKSKLKLLADALVSLHGKGVINIYLPSVSVEELHTLARKEAGISNSSSLIAAKESSVSFFV